MMLKHDTIIKDQLEKGVIEKVDRFNVDGMKHYIPHHLVITPQKATTQLRIVYDTSVKSKFGKSACIAAQCYYKTCVEFYLDSDYMKSGLYLISKRHSFRSDFGKVK